MFIARNRRALEEPCAQQNGPYVRYIWLVISISGAVPSNVNLIHKTTPKLLVCPLEPECYYSSIIFF